MARSVSVVQGNFKRHKSDRKPHEIPQYINDAVNKGGEDLLLTMAVAEVQLAAFSALLESDWLEELNADSEAKRVLKAIAIEHFDYFDEIHRFFDGQTINF